MQSIQLLRSNLAGWVNGSVNRKIFRAALTVGVMTLLVKGVGFAKSLVVAYQFGTADALDAFYIAWILPSMAINVIAAALNSAFVPTYVQLQEQQDQDAAQKLLGNVMVCAIGLLLACAVLLALLAPYILPLLGGSFQAQKLALTETLLLILLITLSIKGMSIIWTGVLNSSHRFALGAITPAIVPASSTIALLCAGKGWSIYAFTVGMVVGFALEAGVLAWQLRQLGISLRPRWSGVDPAMKQVAGQYGAAVAAAFLMSNAGLVDQAMAAMLGSGSVAVLNYAGTLPETILLIGAFALGTAVLPYFSRMVAAKDWRTLRLTLRFYTKLVLLVTIPITILLVLYSEPIIELFFKRGAFTSEDTRLVAEVQTMFALQMPFYVLSYMLLKLLSSLKRKLVLIVGAGINLVVNIAMNYIFSLLFGLKGIALSTSVVYFSSWVFLTIIVQREMRRQETMSGTT
jgi:putative peptidoglycan lipid II flippase